MFQKEFRMETATINGISHSISEWAEELNISRQWAYKLHKEGRLELWVNGQRPGRGRPPTKEKTKEAIRRLEGCSVDEISEKLGLSKKVIYKYRKEILCGK